MVFSEYAECVITYGWPGQAKRTTRQIATYACLPCFFFSLRLLYALREFSSMLILFHFFSVLWSNICECQTRHKYKIFHFYYISNKPTFLYFTVIKPQYQTPIHFGYKQNNIEKHFNDNYTLFVYINKKVPNTQLFLLKNF